MANQKIALVIDDDKETVDMVQDVLKEELQYLVWAATDPGKAVDAARNYAFDLLVLDLHMPKLDGFQVLDMVRKKQPQVKVIVITGLYSKYQDRFQSVKVDRIVQKPLDPEKLMKDIVAVAGSVDLRVEKDGKIPKAKILLVDDEIEICETLKEWLVEDAASDYEVEIAECGKDGISLNNQFEPDIIFFDIKMPHMSGIEMVDLIKGGNGPKPKLYLALSADGGYQDLMNDIQSRGFTVFTKPFHIEKVLEFLKEKCFELGLYTSPNENK